MAELAQISSKNSFSDQFMWIRLVISYTLVFFLMYFHR